MPAKTGRILGHLPDTFRPLPRPTALFAVLDAVGTELQDAENSLAEVLQAHWVDLADRGADEVTDLALLAATYGLLPRPDESVEEFRAHLRRYVRTFLDGTVTVRGLLRMTAEALGLQIADGPAQLDAWWTRRSPWLETVVDRGDDATTVVLGVAEAVSHGAPTRAAAVVGTVDLAAGVDLRPAAVLRVAADGGPVSEVDLVTVVADPAHATAPEIAAALGPAADLVGERYLRLRAPEPGPASRLTVIDGPDDAAERVLGLPPRRSTGEESAPAVLTGADRTGGVVLGPDHRYLRVAVDAAVVELDLGAGRRQLDELCATIDAAIGAAVASTDGHRITLASPHPGADSRVEVQPSAAQDAADAVFGPVDRLALGHDARPARLTGRRDLTGSVDLRADAALVLRIDQVQVHVAVAGANQAAVRREEIIAAINAAAGRPVAQPFERSLAVSSPRPGAAGSVVLETAPVGDAGHAVFGIPPREFSGAAAEPARLVGRADLTAPVDLGARHLLALAVDEAPPREIDLRAAAVDPRHVTLAELVTAVNDAVGLPAPVAGGESGHLVLTSPAPRPEASLAVRRLQGRLRRSYVTRAAVTDDAATVVLGFVDRAAVGTPAAAATVAGTADLRSGVDLSSAGSLRLSVDGGTARDIRCTGKRPRASVLAEVVDAVNADFPGVASATGDRLGLTSPTVGDGSTLAFDVPHAVLDPLGLAPGLTRGVDATSVRLVATVALPGGADLPAHAALAMGIDDAPPTTVPLTGDQPAHLSVASIANAINVALTAPVAVVADDRLVLASFTAGRGSRIQLSVPSGADVTEQLLGIAAPRLYQGSAASAPSVVSAADLTAGVDVRTRWLRLAVDGGEAVDIDVAGRAADPGRATADEIVSAIVAAIPGVASSDGQHLVLASPTLGSAGRIDLRPSPAADARAALLGTVPVAVRGTDPGPASLVGDVPLLTPVDLSRSPVLRVAVDTAVPVDVDASGAVATATRLDEVVAAINAAVPGLASGTQDGRLRLTSPTAGEHSRLAVPARRHLELVEFPPADRPVVVGPTTVRHGSHWTLTSDSVAGEPLTLELRAGRGLFGPAFVHASAAALIRVLTGVPSGARLVLGLDDHGGPVAEVRPGTGAPWPVPAERIRIERLPGAVGEALASAVLTVPPGRSRWQYLDCDVARFGAARFDGAQFAGGRCRQRAVFGVSRFVADDGGRAHPVAVFDGRQPEPDQAAELTASWIPRRPGALRIDLPLDLDARFGARFNSGRFSRSGSSPEFFPAAVTEPPDDERYLVTLISQGHPGTSGSPPVAKSSLVTASVVPVVPPSARPVTMPFRVPVRLSGGAATIRAAGYFVEEGFGGGFLRLQAKDPGAYGNDIAVVVRRAGPGRFDVSVALVGARFENARSVALGDPPPAAGAQLVAPGLVGVLRAKAGGVAATAARTDTGEVRSDTRDEGT
jgi:hypothetical protein